MKEKYLYQRGNCWYINMKIPRSLGKGRIFHSLHTSDIKKARNIRDTYISPIISQIDAVEILEEISTLVTKARNDISNKS